MSFVDDLKNLKNLDKENPGLWPLPIQLIAIAIVCVGLLFGGWKLFTSDQRATIASEENKERDLRGSMEIKQKLSANLNALKEQMKEMEQSFGDMIRQLPNKTEVPGLIVDISQTALAAGLEMKLFEPKGEQKQEFYYQVPINISVTGDYHQLGGFVSGIAALPRIVTTHNVSITRSAGSLLSMSAQARTYRAPDEQ